MECWERLRRLGAIASGTMLAAILSGPATADVVTLPPNGFTSVEPLGRLSMSRTYGPRAGRICMADGNLGADCRMIAAAAEWSPPDLPITVVLERRGAGLALQFASLLQDRKGRPACWSRHELSPRQASSADRAWETMQAGFNAWAQGCDVVRELGADQTRSAFAALRADLGQAHAVLRGVRGLPDSEAEISLGSFLPTRVSQSLLDAVAVACGGSPGQARREADGRIVWDFDRSVGHGPDGARPFGVCVDDQIRHYPGYQRRR